MILNIPFLSAIDFELIIYGAAFLILIASGVFNAAKKASQKRPGQGGKEFEALERKLKELFGQSESPQSRPSSQGGATDLDRLAALRRRRLQELARQRQGKAASTPSGPAGRASAPARPAQQVSSSTSPRTIQSGASRPGVAQRRTPPPQRVRPQRQPAARQAPPRQTPPRRQAPQRPQAVRPQSPSPRQAQTVSSGGQVAAMTHGLVAAKARGGETGYSGPLKLSPTVLRQALVLKEILDPPVALRVF